MTLREKLEHQGVTLAPKLTYQSAAPLDAETLALLKTHKDDLLRDLIVSTGYSTPERLPWQLERLISAACADALPQGTVTLPSGLVPDLNRYVLGWGCSYLVSDRIEAEKRLWEAYRAWQGVN